MNIRQLELLSSTDKKTWLENRLIKANEELQNYCTPRESIRLKIEIERINIELSKL